VTDAVPSAVTRHDLLLALIAAPLAVGAFLALAFPISLRVALAAGSLPAGGGLGYALFFRPPAAADGE
jgi:hypothetical protein